MRSFLSGPCRKETQEMNVMSSLTLHTQEGQTKRQGHVGPYHECFLLLHGLETTMTKLGGGVNEFQVNLL